MAQEALPPPPIVPARSERRRSRILEVLLEADEPLELAGLAERLGAHPNTLRTHLRALVDAGLVVKEARRGARGRPRIVYRAAPGADRAGRADEYRKLAKLLATAIASGEEPSERARETGERWGRQLVEERPPVALDEEEGLAQLDSLLGRLGFEPELEREEDGRVRVLMRRCPFRDVAAEFREVVCPLHLGIIQGALAQLGLPAGSTILVPFVEPTLCVATLAEDGRQRAGARGAAR